MVALRGLRSRRVKCAGTAMIVTIGLTAAFTIALGVFAAVMRVDGSLSARQAASAQARLLARAGIEAAIDQLRRDPNLFDHAGEAWHANETVYSDVPLGPGYYHVGLDVDSRGHTLTGVIDEARKININYASPEVLHRLPGLTQTLVDRIVAMRDERPFETPDELLLVEGLTPDRFYDREPPLSELVTTFTSGKVNVNTASVSVLSCFPQIGPELARKIAAGRAGRDVTLGTGDDEPFQDTKELVRVGLSPARCRRLNTDLTVTSDVFTIIANGRTGAGGQTRGSCSIKAVVDRSRGRIKILYWKEG